ncbi:MAG: PAS domain-containing hybrid sensor histidine kinase/response regulator [Candidatus Kariarchaeaceae archaeon]
MVDTSKKLVVEDINELISMKKNVIRHLIDNSPTYIFINDIVGKYIYASDTFFTDTGYSEKDFLNQNSFEFIHPEDRERVLKHLGKINEGMRVRDIEYRFLRKNGQYVYYSSNASPIYDSVNNVIAVLTTTNDISVRKEIEGKLKEEEKRFRLLFENSFDAIFWADSETGIMLNCNKSATKLLEKNKDEIIGKHHTEMYLEEDKARANQIFNRTIDHDKVLNLQILTKTGKLKPVEISANEITISGKTIRQGVFRDISERFQTEQDLRESEERYRLLFQNMIDGYAFHKVVTDEAGNPIDYIYVDINPAFSELTGMTREQMIGKRVTEAIPGTENDPADWIGRFGEVGLKGTTLHVEEYSEALEKYYEVNGWSPKKGYFAVTFSDITDKKRLEEERLQYLKIESLAVLAGGIAHDYNNILVGILGNINIMQLDQNLPEKSHEILTEMENATLRASQLTNQLLTFSKGGVPVTQPEEISKIIKDSSSFSLRGSKSNCIISTPDDLPMVEIDAGQINQLMSNLIINADQAMPKGGTISISVEKKIISEDNKFGLDSGDYIKVSVTDEGIGISEENLPRIFDPYFTTKTMGSGLGLATSYSIVKRHGGHIDLETKIGIGTSFYFYLPVSSKLSPQTQEKQIPLAKFDDYVLLMDDDKGIQTTVKMMLNEINIDTDIARDGTEAIRMYKNRLKREKPYSIVIMDLTIPGGMSGLECIKVLQDLDPNINAIVSSGYSNDPVMGNFQNYGFKGVLAKPFTLNQLTNVIKEVKGSTEN